MCGDCLEIIPSLIKDGVVCDGVITSPPYNLGKNPNHRKKNATDHSFYSAYEDAKSPEEYITWVIQLFTLLEKIIKRKGVILWNMSYSSKDASLPYRLITAIEAQSRWNIVDTICWKKPTAMPFQTSPRNLSRITELVFVFAQDKDFITNKAVKSINSKTGQKFYAYVDNFIEAPCSDPGTRKCHKATFSCGLVEELLKRYFPEGSVILDPFCGTGTTGVACKQTDRHYIIMDIDPTYTEFSKQRVSKIGSEV